MTCGMEVITSSKALGEDRTERIAGATIRAVFVIAPLSFLNPHQPRSAMIARVIVVGRPDQRMFPGNGTLKTRPPSALAGSRGGLGATRDARRLRRRHASFRSGAQP
jgi:hypothetical protein